MAISTDLLVKVESLKNAVAARVTGGYADHGAYHEIRLELLDVQRVKDKLPRFVLTCRSLDEVWNFIQPKLPAYRERRQYLHDEFEPLLSMLESESATPGDIVASEALEVVDSAHARDAWNRCLERRANDPEGAITAARTLLETVCKHILDECAVEYDDKVDLPKLFGMAAEQLQLAPNQHTEKEFKRILGGCFTVVDGLACLRNRLSDAHGKGKNAAQPKQRHAELAVNLAGSVATFLVATWESKKAWEKRRGGE